MFRWHTGAKKVETLAFAPDGGLLASASYGAEVVKLWQPDGTPAGKLSLGFRVHAVGYCPLGRYLAVCTEQRRVVLCGAGQPSFLGVVFNAGEPARAVAVAPDGSRLAVLTVGHILSWDRPAPEFDPRPHGRPPDHTADRTDYYPTSALAFAPDGRRLVVNQDGEAVVWDVPTGRAVRTVPHPSAGFVATRLAVSAAGRVAASYGRDIDLWSLDDDAPPVTLFGSRKGRSVRGLGFTPDAAHLLAAGSDGVARRWDALTGTELQTWDFGLKNLQSLAVSPDGLTAAAGAADGTVVVWDL